MKNSTRPFSFVSLRVMKTISCDSFRTYLQIFFTILREYLQIFVNLFKKNLYYLHLLVKFPKIEDFPRHVQTEKRISAFGLTKKIRESSFHE